MNKLNLQLFKILLWLMLFGVSAEFANAQSSKSLNPLEIDVLDDVVVIGYGSVKKSDLTGAVSSLSSKVIEQAPPNSFQAAMAGKLAGVNISQIDASPNARMNILIRGENTLTGGNQPLYVIDGFPLLPDQVNNPDENASNPLADLSPSMIAWYMTDFNEPINYG